MSPYARAMLCNRSREAWRALPMHHIVLGTLDGPMLAFDELHDVDATMLRADIADLYMRWRKAFTPERKKAYALRIRRSWLKLCTLAIGVRVPGSRVVWGFDDDYVVELQRPQLQAGMQ